MTGKRKSPLIYYPKTISELLSLYKSMPDSLLYAGGTGILRDKASRYPALDKNIIFLTRIGELSAIRRSEGYLEIGACTRLNKLLGIGEHVLKPALYLGIRNISTREIRNLATIGGNICSPYRVKSLHPLLALLDTRLEIRKQGSSRWENIRRFHSAEGGLGRGEILTRIRIPFNSFNCQAFTVTGNQRTDYGNALTFCCLASVQKEILSSIRFSAGFGDGSVFRARDFEDALSGRKLPIFGLTDDPVYNRLTTALKSQENEISAFNRRHIEGLFMQFLHQINDMV